jgi:hypothetical protein
MYFEPGELAAILEAISMRNLAIEQAHRAREFL